jgi:hypothetical protein
LKQFLAEEWEATPIDMLINLVLSMKPRCEEVLEKKGDRIGY